MREYIIFYTLYQIYNIEHEFADFPLIMSYICLGRNIRVLNREISSTTAEIEMKTGSWLRFRPCAGQSPFSIVHLGTEVC